MVFKLKVTLGNVRMNNGEWKISLTAPASEATEVAKICLACQDEPLNVTIESEVPEVIGEQA